MFTKLRASFREPPPRKPLVIEERIVTTYPTKRSLNMAADKRRS